MQLEALIKGIELIAPPTDARVRIDVYGGGIDESYLRGNAAGLLQLALRLLRSSLAPYKNTSSSFNPKAVNVELDNLFHDESDITIDWIERTEDLTADTHLESSVRKQLVSDYWSWLLALFCAVGLTTLIILYAR